MQNYPDLELRDKEGLKYWTNKKRNRHNWPFPAATIPPLVSAADDKLRYLTDNFSRCQHFYPFNYPFPYL